MKKISSIPDAYNGIRILSAFEDRPKRFFRLAFVLCLSLLASACQNIQIPPLPEPLREPQPPVWPSAASEEIPISTPLTTSREAKEGEGTSLRISRPPGVSIQRTMAEGIADRMGQDLTGDPVLVSFNEVPLVTFINEVFGQELGMSFVISPELRQRSDLVTLRLTEPLPPSRLFAAARQVLREYGIELREAEGLITFSLSQESATREIPLLISGRALPEVPPSHRTIFQLVPLRVMRSPQVIGWLRQAFEGQPLQIAQDGDRNALLLSGSAELIAQALDMMDVLDQPLLHGRYGIIIEPRYLDAQSLARALETVLLAEGYQPSIGRIGGSSVLLPIDGTNKLIVFAADQDGLDHILEWARVLDEDRSRSVEQDVYSYLVRNVKAESITATIGQMRPQIADGEDRAPGTLVVDANTNTLFFRGTGVEWAAILDIARRLDKPEPAVLIEVLLAEITLSDSEGSGFEFLIKNDIGDRSLTGRTLNALGVSARGLSFALDSAGQTRAALSFFRESNRVVIHSNPRLLVRSGKTASINVGNEIPLITQRSAEQTTQTSGTSDIVQQVTYRKTGVDLSVTPTVQANGLVELDINQSLSEARPAASTSLEGSPTILNRQVSTSLVLRDGGSLLMGGLISNTQSDGRNDLPGGLSDVPLLGSLFRADNFQKDRTELIIMVIPYVVNSNEEARRLTATLRDQMNLRSGMSIGVDDASTGFGAPAETFSAPDPVSAPSAPESFVVEPAESDLEPRSKAEPEALQVRPAPGALAEARIESEPETRSEAPPPPETQGDVQGPVARQGAR